MARFTVHLTFETPAQQAPLAVTHRLAGRTGSLTMHGGGGTLAVIASGVRAESPTDAAMVVVKTVNDRWLKSRGAITMRSWAAHQERVLVGRRGRMSSTGLGWDDSGGEGGSAGVREPRRPLPGPGSLHAERDRPGPGPAR